MRRMYDFVHRRDESIFQDASDLGGWVFVCSYASKPSGVVRPRNTLHCFVKVDYSTGGFTPPLAGGIYGGKGV